MSLPTVRPTLREQTVSTYCSSIASSPVAVSVVAPFKGKIKRTFAVSNGVTTGTTAIAVTTTSQSSDIGAGGLSIAAGTGPIPVEDFPTNASGAALVSENDFITFTPSGGTGTNITGWFSATISEEG